MFAVIGMYAWPGCWTSWNQCHSQGCELITVDVFATFRIRLLGLPVMFLDQLKFIVPLIRVALMWLKIYGWLFDRHAW